MDYYSWGRISLCKPIELFFPENRLSELNTDSKKILSVGGLRSYSDVCYNDDGLVINNRYLNHFIDFDRENGILTAEAGVTLKQILELTTPEGWFLPVTPGTKYVTLGGALANDVHGKNHHNDGSFGCFVIAFELTRSNGERMICDLNTNTSFYYATIGGLGLTGWITWVKIKLLRIKNNCIVTKALRFNNLHGFFELNKEFESKHKYTVSWVDCTASGNQLGRGIFYIGDHSEVGEGIDFHEKKLSLPFVPPFSLVNKINLKLFNQFYYNKKLCENEVIQHYEPFFYPLDKISNWNNIYGKRGFYQYQCVLPKHNAEIVLTDLLRTINKSGLGSFLAVLKTFGNKHSGGLMSFPREGVTLALDFANIRGKTKELFYILDNIVYDAGGALYPAKDGRMTKKMFEFSFPNLNEFIKFIDPKFSSNFWCRVRGDNL